MDVSTLAYEKFKDYKSLKIRFQALGLGMSKTFSRFFIFQKSRHDDESSEGNLRINIH